MTTQKLSEQIPFNTTPLSNSTLAVAKSSLSSEQGAAQEDINFANSDLDELQGFSKSNAKEAISNTSVLAKSSLNAQAGVAESDTTAYKEYVRMEGEDTTQLSAKIDEIKAKWVKLCDYGDYNHAQGLQRLTFSAAQKMAHKHRSLYSRLKRYFGGTPIYIGHPDDPAYRNQPGHSDTRAYAWVHRVEARADGLYILPTWSQAGKRLLNEAAYKYLSPRWKVAVLADGSFEPVELISIGLTNQPNIQGPAIANQAQATEALQAQTQENSTDALTQIAALMEMPIDASAASVVDALAERIDQINAAADAIEAQSDQPKTFMSNSLQDYTTTRANLRQKFVDEVHARMNQTGEDFSSAWSNIKATRREVFQKTTPVLV